MTKGWKYIGVRELTYDGLRRLWSEDGEAQRRGQKFTPWVDMFLKETMTDYERIVAMRKVKVKTRVPESDVRVVVS